MSRHPARFAPRFRDGEEFVMPESLSGTGRRLKLKAAIHPHKKTPGGPGGRPGVREQTA
jgi:hypothetical protein